MSGHRDTLWPWLLVIFESAPDKTEIGLRAVERDGDLDLARRVRGRRLADNPIRLEDFRLDVVLAKATESVGGVARQDVERAALHTQGNA